MEIILTIDGMHCGGCATAVRNVLLEVPAVENVTVDLERGRATVSANPGVDTAALVAAVEDAGYEARPQV